LPGVLYLNEEMKIDAPFATASGDGTIGKSSRPLGGRAVLRAMKTGWPLRPSAGAPALGVLVRPPTRTSAGPGQIAMSSDPSFDDLMARLRAGQDDAATQVFNRFAS